MEIHHAKEAAVILNQFLDVIFAASPVRGRNGADVRTAVGYLKVYSEDILYNDRIVEYLDRIFNLAQHAGVIREQFGFARRLIQATEPLTLGGILIRDAIIELCLATECLIIANMTFRSRHKIDEIRSEMHEAFLLHEEDIANDMDSMTYRNLIMLHAAIIQFLTEAIRPLPRMLRFSFNRTMSTLVMSHRLYGYAGRADQLRYENRIIHPAFALRQGRALSS